jgi:hypothetical protein
LSGWVLEEFAMGKYPYFDLSGRARRPSWSATDHLGRAMRLPDKGLTRSSFTQAMMLRRCDMRLVRPLAICWKYLNP